MENPRENPARLGFQGSLDGTQLIIKANTLVLCGKKSYHLNGGCISLLKMRNFPACHLSELRGVNQYYLLKMHIL